jgi:hypothetical protein
VSKKCVRKVKTARGNVYKKTAYNYGDTLFEKSNGIRAVFIKRPPDKAPSRGRAAEETVRAR